jgi:hypothetical protein
MFVVNEISLAGGTAAPKDCCGEIHEVALIYIAMT